MIRRFIRRLSKLPRSQKQLFLVLMDAFFVVLALWGAYSLRFGVPYEPFGTQPWLWVFAPVLALPVFIYFDLYRAILRYIGFHSLWSLAQAVSLYALLWGLVAFLSGIPLVPRSVVIINGILCLLMVGGSRLLVRWWFVDDAFKLKFQKQKPQRRKQVMIYGAGEAGVQLSMLLLYDPASRAVVFVDDNPELHKRIINGLPVISHERIEETLAEYDIDEIMLAIPSLSRPERKRILSSLEPYPVLVKTLPDVNKIAQGKVQMEDIREVEISDLLGRDPVDPIENLLDANIKGKSVMVTGAGGSIGAELCRQILLRDPDRLVLLESSEFALYEIERELRARHGPDKLVCALENAQNQHRVERICKQYGVHTIYHAAAYKHVPMIEMNPLVGIENNIFGTWSMAHAALNSHVETFVLISSDKAVRPTNVMGATKRFAELILQAMDNKTTTTHTRFSMVRFGNVLGSSGSVVPLFHQQIKKGGPITVTGDDVVRYFMTIREAALLVIQAGAMNERGGLYVLKMGEPVKIIDLARQMIHLSGLEVKDAQHPHGDIEIEVTGLRPGEKRYEELLIDGRSSETTHPRIFAGHEDSVDYDYLQSCLNTFRQAIEQGDAQIARRTLQEAIKEYAPEAKAA